jgi:transposase
MPRTRPPYSPEYRQQILDLVRAGHTPNELAREFEPSGETIRQWVKPAELDGGERQDGLTSNEKMELAQLRKEKKRLRQERELGRLKRAITKPPPGSVDESHRLETNAVPPKSSDATERTRRNILSEPCAVSDRPAGSAKSHQVAIMPGGNVRLQSVCRRMRSCSNAIGPSIPVPRARMALRASRPNWRRTASMSGASGWLVS